MVSPCLEGGKSPARDLYQALAAGQWIGVIML
jgi:hypothetical protein